MESARILGDLSVGLVNPAAGGVVDGRGLVVEPDGLRITAKPAEGIGVGEGDEAEGTMRGIAGAGGGAQHEVGQRQGLLHVDAQDFGGLGLDRGEFRLVNGIGRPAVEDRGGSLCVGGGEELGEEVRHGRSLVVEDEARLS